MIERPWPRAESRGSRPTSRDPSATDVRATADDLDAWVDGIRAGTHAAFSAVHRAMADDLVSFAYGMVRDRRTAEDIVQQSFVELVGGCERFRGDGRALRSWLYRSVRFGCLDEFRRRRRRPETPTDRLPEEVTHQDPLDHHLEPRLEAALDALSGRQRTMILLRHVVGLSGGEIAEVLMTPRTAVYASLGRAERRLKRLLDGDMGGPQ